MPASEVNKNTIDTSYLFSNLDKLTENKALNQSDTSRVTDMHNIIYRVIRLRSSVLSSFDTREIYRIYMRYIFQHMSLFSLFLGNHVNMRNLKPMYQIILSITMVREIYLLVPTCHNKGF